MDAERLNWLEENQEFAIAYNGNGRWAYVCLTDLGPLDFLLAMCDIPPSAWKPSIRAAIDYAMAKTKGKKHDKKN